MSYVAERVRPSLRCSEDARGAITIAVSANRRRAGKAFRLDRDGRYQTIHDRQKDWLYYFETAGFDTLEQLFQVLTKVADDQFSFVLRGVPIEPSSEPQLRRIKLRTYLDGRAPEPPTLREEPLFWVALDFDKLPMPPDRDLQGMTPDEIAEYALSICPPEFWSSSCILQLTSSHALEPNKIRCRLWLLLSRPVMGAELKAWFQGCPVDASIFGAHQPIYTANPEFVECPDPVPLRWFLIKRKGGEVVQVPPAFPAPPEKLARVKQADAGVSRGKAVASVWPPLDKPKGWLRLLYMCGDGPGRYGFYRPITSAVGSYIAIYGPDADPEPFMLELDFILEIRGFRTRTEEYLEVRRADARIWFQNCCALERANNELVECQCPDVPRASLSEAEAMLCEVLD